MSVLNILVILVAAIAVCCGRMAKRQAPDSINICDVSSVDVWDGSDFDLTSPSYGYGNYQDNTNCATALQSDSDPLQITVTFISEDIEFVNQCYWDWLCLNSVKFCGNWANKKSFRFLLPEYSTFTIGFSTDSSVTRSGWLVNIQASLTTSDDEIFQPDSGFGSAANQISYKQVSYDSGYAYAYTDRCAVNSQPYWYYSSSSSNNTWGNYTTPSYNGSWNWNTTTSPSYNGSWDWNNNTRPSYNGSWNWNNNTRPSYNGSWNWNNNTTPSYNGSWNWNNNTTPSYNGSWNNNTSPSRNGNWNNYTSPSNFEARFLAVSTTRRPNSSTARQTSTTRRSSTTTRRW